MIKPKVRVIAHTMDLTNEEEFKVEQARLKIERVLNIEEFRYFVLGFSWESAIVIGHLWWKKYYKQEVSRFASTHFTNKDVYTRIMSGYATLDPEEDGVIDIYLKIDRRNKRRVLGYTYPTTKTQWVYNWFFRSGTVDDVAGNIFHEALHKMNFEHDYKYTQRRPYSIPYAIGYFVRDF